MTQSMTITTNHMTYSHMTLNGSTDEYTLLGVYDWPKEFTNSNTLLEYAKFSETATPLWLHCSDIKYEQKNSIIIYR